PQRLPEEKESRHGVCGELVALPAFAVGEEHETAVVVTLQEHHSRSWDTSLGCGRERHRVRLLNAGRLGVCVPIRELADRIWVEFLLEHREGGYWWAPLRWAHLGSNEDDRDSH